MHTVPETKKNHIWRKAVWHTDFDLRPLGPHHYAEIYCCEETNGYTVWYVRRLSKEDQLGNADTENGDYLLTYFAKDRRDDALEHAVLLANRGADVNAIIAALDTAAQSAQKL